MNRLVVIDPAPRSFDSTWPAGTERIVRWKDAWPYLKYKRVWIDVRKLDVILQPGDRVGVGGQDGIARKYSGVEEFMASGKAVYMPQLRLRHVNDGGFGRQTIGIHDGRHRFAWMRDHGAQALPVTAKPDEAHEIARLVGTGVRVCRIRIADPWRLQLE